MISERCYNGAMEVLKKLVINHYDIGTISNIVLIRSFTNDVYKVSSNYGEYALKVYGNDWRTDSQVLWELDLVQVLAHQTDVANYIPTKDGKPMIKQDKHQIVLYEFAPGEKPKLPVDIQLRHTFGKATAIIHKISQNFTSIHNREVMDMDYFVTKPLDYLQSKLPKTIINELSDIAMYCRKKLIEMSDELDWGVCHGDVTLDNIHVMNGKITFFDFDSAAFSWRASEFQGIYMSQLENNNGAWDAFLRGYRSVREFSNLNEQAVKYFAPLYELTGVMHYLSRNKEFPSGKAQEYADISIAKIKAWAQNFLD